MTRAENPPVNPFSRPLPEGGTIHDPGILLRDHIAVMAMIAIIQKKPFGVTHTDDDTFRLTADGSYRYADAMLAARQGGGHD